MQQLILIIHILDAIAIIALVLLQQTKGGGMGSAFGGGSSGTVFGAQGSMTFLFKLTAFLVAVFFTTSIVLARMSASASPVHQVRSAPASTSLPSLPVTGPATKLPPQSKTKSQ